MSHSEVQYNGAKTIKAVLRQLALNETEQQIAARLGVTQSWVSDHITGRRKTVQKRIRPRVAAGLSISVSHLSLLCRKN